MGDADLQEPGRMLEELLQSVDADILICASPTPACLLARRMTHLPMLLHLSLAWLFPAPKSWHAFLLADMRRLLLEQPAPRTTLVVASCAIVAKQLLFQTGALPYIVKYNGLHLPHVWRREQQHCLLEPNRTFLGGHIATSEFFVQVFFESLKEFKVGDERIKVVSSHEGLIPFRSFADFRLIVLLPWNTELTCFAEFYAMQIPLFVPDVEYVAYIAADRLQF